MDCMPESILKEKTSPPRLIASLVEGFNVIAGRSYILLFPIGIDLLFWFGPLLRVRKLLMPMLKNIARISAPNLGAENQVLLESSMEIWEFTFERLNLLFSLRTFPVGVPSLLINLGSLENPLGKPIIIEMLSFQNILGIAFLLVLIGIIFGAMYYEMVSCAVNRQKQVMRTSNLSSKLIQTAILTGMLLLAGFILGVPLLCLLSTIAFLLPSLGSFPFLIGGSLLVWLLLPLVFSAHGIFYGELKATQSIVTSLRLVRRIMSPVGIFMILIILIGFGLDSLWVTPPTHSWMLLIGIFGHGFISSGLLAATFVFYRDGLSWLNEITREREKEAHSLPS